MGRRIGKGPRSTWIPASLFKDILTLRATYPRADYVAVNISSPQAA
jgi:hypothetical protein